MSNTITALTGLSSIGIIEATEAIPSPDEITNYAKLFIQIAVAIVTLWRMFKGPKQNKGPVSKDSKRIPGPLEPI